MQYPSSLIHLFPTLASPAVVYIVLAAVLVIIAIIAFRLSSRIASFKNKRFKVKFK